MTTERKHWMRISPAQRAALIRLASGDTLRYWPDTSLSIAAAAWNRDRATKQLGSTVEALEMRRLVELGKPECFRLVTLTDQGRSVLK